MMFGYGRLLLLFRMYSTKIIACNVSNVAAFIKSAAANAGFRTWVCVVGTLEFSVGFSTLFSGLSFELLKE
ncbi:hypothetical protein RchiOBHm_Chr1g0382531 [Rosa chinensis]|uniref:Uncharacterized protein n=1 Tax=Rosa chinensis TaxID=74649 RepID=A0A2P6SPF0_ROSCH|nr:hypothetical protein RchiOBHm_Chr1g0382531 [Rosa chinensis]